MSPGTYQWEASSHPKKADVAALPDSLLELMTVRPLAPDVPEPTAKVPLGKAALAFVANGAPVGQQREQAVAAGRNYLSAGYSVDQAAAALWRGFTASPTGEPERPWSHQDAYAIAADLAGRPAPPLSPLSSNGRGTLTDIDEEAWAPPVPLTEQHGPPFPLDALPDDTRRYAEAVAMSIQVPVDLVVAEMLGAGAAAAAGRCVIRVHKQFFQPLNDYHMSVGKSGERRTPTQEFVMAPIREQQKKLRQASEADRAEAQAMKDVLEAKLKNAKTQLAAGEAIEEEVKELAKAVAEKKVPPPPQLIADDITPEAVGRRLAEQDGRLAIVSSEGGIFDTIAGRYNDGLLNADVFLKGYSGEPIIVDRSRSDSVSVDNPTLTMVLSVQPDVVVSLGTKKSLRGRGLTARFSYYVPPSKVGYRDDDNAPLVPPNLIKAWDETLTAIMRIPTPPEGEEHAIRLSDDAMSLFRGFRKKVEVLLRPGEKLSDLDEWGGKLTGKTLRMAGILHLFQNRYGDGRQNPWDIPISRETMRAAVRISNYLIDHALVFFAMMRADNRMELARKAWEAIRRAKWETFSVRELFQRVRRSFQDVGELEGALTMLEDLGYVRRDQPTAQQGAGRPPSPSFSVNPIALEKCTQNTQNPPVERETGNFVDSVYGFAGTEIESRRDDEAPARGIRSPDERNSAAGVEGKVYGSV